MVFTPACRLLSFLNLPYSLEIISGIAYDAYEEQTMYSTKEAASKMGLSEQHVRYLLAKGEIEGKLVGKTWVVSSLDYKRKRKPRGGRNR